MTNKIIPSKMIGVSAIGLEYDERLTFADGYLSQINGDNTVSQNSAYAKQYLFHARKASLVDKRFYENLKEADPAKWEKLQEYLNKQK